MAETGGGSKKFASPAEVLAAAQAANDRNDTAAFLDCLSPEGQAANVSFALALTTSLEAQPVDAAAPDAGKAAPAAPADPNAPTAADEKKMRQDLDAFFNKHDLKDRKKLPGEDEKKYIERLTAKVKDKRAFLMDFATFQGTPPKDAQPVRKNKPELKDLKITGDKATAKIVIKEDDNTSMSSDVEFRQVDGSWLIASVMMF